MGKPQKLECRHPRSVPLCPESGKRAKFRHSGFLRRDFQMELSQSGRHYLHKMAGVRLPFKAGHIIISIPDKTAIPLTLRFYTLFKPEIQRVVKIDVRQQWRNRAALRHSFITCPVFSAFTNTGLQKAFDVSEDASVGYPVLHKRH